MVNALIEICASQNGKHSSPVAYSTCVKFELNFDGGKGTPGRRKRAVEQRETICREFHWTVEWGRVGDELERQFRLERALHTLPWSLEGHWRTSGRGGLVSSWVVLEPPLGIWLWQEVVSGLESLADNHRPFILSKPCLKCLHFFLNRKFFIIRVPITAQSPFFLLEHWPQ